jgi:hypothetical protein
MRINALAYIEKTSSKNGVGHGFVGPTITLCRLRWLAEVSAIGRLAS